MLESVMIIRLATGAMVEVVVPFGFSKAGFLSGCPVELGVVAASKEGTEDAEFHAGVGADGGYTHGAPERAEEDAVGVDLAGLPHLAPEVSRTDGCDVFHEFADGIVGYTQVMLL